MTNLDEVSDGDRRTQILEETETQVKNVIDYNRFR